MEDTFWRDLKADEKKTNFNVGYNNLNLNYPWVAFILNSIRANGEQLLNNTIIHNDARYFSGRPIGHITYKGFDHSEVTFNNGEKTFERPADAALLTPISYNENELIWSGKMGEQRVGELLPLDFEPSKTDD